MDPFAIGLRQLRRSKASRYAATDLAGRKALGQTDWPQPAFGGTAIVAACNGSADFVKAFPSRRALLIVLRKFLLFDKQRSKKTGPTKQVPGLKSQVLCSVASAPFLLAQAFASDDRR